MASPGLLIMTGARGAITGSSAWSALTPASANLTINNGAFTTEFDQTSGVNWTWANVTPALAGTPQPSPAHVFTGQYWNGSASAPDSWTVQNVIGSGTNGTSALTFTHSGTSGAVVIAVPGAASVPSIQMGTTSGIGIGQGSIANTLGLYTNQTSGRIQFFFGTYRPLDLETTVISTLPVMTFLNNGLNFNLGVSIPSNFCAISDTFANTTTTSGTCVAHAIGQSNSLTNALFFGPSSGNASLYALLVTPWIDQTGTATGNWSGLAVYPYVQASLGTATSNYLLELGTINQSGFFSATLTRLFAVDMNGNVTSQNPIAATSSVSQSSPLYTFSGQYWNGSASATDQWTIQDVVANGTNGASTLTFTHSGSTGVAQVSAPSYLAGVGTVTNPSFSIYNGATAIGGMYSQNSVLAFATGSTPQFSLALSANKLSLPSASVIGWGGIVGNPLSSDTGISRISAGLLALGNGTAGDTTGNLQLNQVTKYNGETVAAPGIPYTRGVTSQKNETGADANVLTVTPAAAAGVYRLSITMSVSAATAATLGWTATWTDGNSNAQAPTNIDLDIIGTAGFFLTVNPVAGSVCTGECVIDVNNSGTNIVIKTTFSGTSIAYKVSAIIERLI